MKPAALLSATVMAAGVGLTGTPAAANDASFYGHGATVFAYAHADVVMESERIRLHYDPAGGQGRRWRAECAFVFRNTSDRPVRVLMGFPDSPAFGEARGPNAERAIRDFRVVVGGEKVAAEYRRIDDEARPDFPNRVKLGYPAAYTWTVAFPAQGTVVVENTYRAGGIATNGPFDTCVTDEETNVWWRGAGKTKAGWDFEDAVCGRMTYVVTTGRTWAAPIGRADIAIQIPPGLLPTQIAPLPAASEVRHGWVRWRFEDYTPTRELSLAYIYPIPRRDERVEFAVFDTVKQARAYVRFAETNGVAAAELDRLLLAYEHPEQVGLRPSWSSTTTPPAARTRTRSDRAIVRVLRRAAARLRAEEVKRER